MGEIQAPPDIGTLAALAGQPRIAMSALADAYQAAVGYRMLTVLLYDRGTGQGRRIYSSSPATHPAGAYKDIPRTDWVDHVLTRREIFVAHTVAEFRPHYSDWQALEEMGLLSGVNFPIVIDGETIGSVNLTADEEGYYAEARIAAARPLQGLAALALLLQERSDRRPEAERA
ncbi:MAG TPA: GAF domain-containing protein [Sphingomonas sp.]